MVARVFISGFVHNVGFRRFIRKKADELRVTGWTRNMPDGRVEALFQGSKENIERVVKECWNGPFLSEVRNIDVEWVKEKEKHSSFDIKP